MKNGRKFSSVAPQLLVQGTHHQLGSKIALGDTVCINCVLDEGMSFFCFISGKGPSSLIHGSTLPVPIKPSSDKIPPSYCPDESFAFRPFQTVMSPLALT